MSTVERNKGKLIPIDQSKVIDNDDHPEYDTFRYEHVKINGVWYKIEKSIKTDYDCDYFCEVTANIDGSYDFHSMHYNGGGSLSEVLCDEIKKIDKQ